MSFESTGVRRSPQARARIKHRRIVDAASKVMSVHGIAGLTHRLVAQEAGVSLAATTYHFESKADIVNAAASATLESYDLAFAKALDRFGEEGGTATAFLDYFFSLIKNTAGRARVTAICWGEIMLDGPRHPDAPGVIAEWFLRTRRVWAGMISSCGLDHADQRATLAIDVLIGLLFLIVGLGLTEKEVSKILAGQDLLDFQPKLPDRREAKPVREGAKAIATRAKILAATIDILRREGTGAVSGRTVAERAGLARAATYYYFDGVAELLAAAQHKLFARSKERYRQGLSESGSADVDFDHLIDRTAAVFLREVTEYAGESVANYSVWLRAESQPEVCAMIWEAAADQHRSWSRALCRWKPDLAPVDPLLGQVLFIGKLVRMLATGSRIQDLAGIRREFAIGLKSIVDGSSATIMKQYKKSK